MGALGRIYASTTNKLPPAVAARIDLTRPSLYGAWGGPLNGQERRREMVRDIARTVPIDRVIETGTYRGTSTEFFAAVFGVPVDTVETHPRYYEYSRIRLSSLPQVRVNHADSRTFLADLA